MRIEVELVLLADRPSYGSNSTPADNHCFGKPDMTNFARIKIPRKHDYK